MRVPTYIDAAIEQAEADADAVYRDQRTRTWLEMRLGPGPWSEADRRRELDALGLLVRAQAEAGVRTWLERPAPREDRALCWTCEGPMPEGSKETKAYCSQACQKRDYARRRAGETPRRRRSCLGCRRAIAPDAHPSRRYCTPACQKRTADRAYYERQRAKAVDA